MGWIEAWYIHLYTDICEVLLYDLFLYIITINVNEQIHFMLVFRVVSCMYDYNFHFSISARDSYESAPSLIST